MGDREQQRIRQIKAQQEQAAAAAARAEMEERSRRVQELEQQWAAFLAEQRSRGYPDAQVITSHFTTRRRSVLGRRIIGGGDKDVLVYRPRDAMVLIDTDLQMHMGSTYERSPGVSWSHYGPMSSLVKHDYHGLLERDLSPPSG